MAQTFSLSMWAHPAFNTETPSSSENLSALHQLRVKSDPGQRQQQQRIASWPSSACSVALLRLRCGAPTWVRFDSQLV
jgi:hypothetical protein